MLLTKYSFMKHLSFTILLSLLNAYTYANAEDKILSGSVTDANGETIPGATLSG